MIRFKLKPLVAMAALVAAGAAHAADTMQPGEANVGLKLKLAGFAEGARDLGRTDDLGARIDADEETAEGYLDAQGTLYWQMSRNWASYTRVQGFVPSGEIVVYDEEDPRRSDAYFALRELWLEYGGLTSYPGEYLRFGRQRIRDYDGLWWDRDAEAVRWIFDTTLLQMHVGIAEQFHTLRTDDSELPISERDRAYAIAGLSQQWRAGHFYGLRATHGFDHIDLDDEVNSTDEDRKLSKRRFTWLGAYSHNGYHDVPETAGLYYWIQGNYLVGNREDYRPAEPPPPDDPGAPGTPALRLERDTRAWSGDVGLRVRFAAPLAIGVAYAYGQGGGLDDPDESNTYEQPGLHSNRSRFTGTRSVIYRFNDALQAELSNLRVASAFLSIPGDRFDASLIYHRFDRDDGNIGVETDGLDIQPTTTDTFLGDGYDLVLTGYFGTAQPEGLGDSEDLRSNVRLRGSLFQPGEAYGEVDEDQYRVTLEVTLWF